MPGTNIDLSTGANLGVTPSGTTPSAPAGTPVTSAGIPLSAYLGAGMGLLQAYGTYQQNSQIHNTEGYEELYKTFGNQDYTGDFNSLIQQRKSSYLDNAPSWKDIRVMDSGAKTSSAIQSGMSGAMAGAGFGPWGIGLGASLFGSSRGDTKAKQKEAELKLLREKALEDNQRNFLNGVQNAEMQTDFQALSNIAAFGGPLQSYGGDWTNGLISIENGGSHERNPYEGVPMGVDQNGTPNLVEEGETVFRDYVFSKRLSVPKAIREKYKLRGAKTLSFAEASKKLAKESEERPNDPISQRGLEAAMADLAMEQEKLRGRKSQQQGNKFDTGGPFNSYGYVKGYNGGWYTDYYFDTKPETAPAAEIDLTPEEYKHRWEGWRYAPAVGLGLATLTDTLGLTNKPDYSNADAVIKAGRDAMSPQQVEWNPIGDYLTYSPLDTLFYSNQLAAQANATRRAIRNNANGNRMTAIAGLLGADYNAQQQLGNLYRQAEEYNLAQRHQVGTFNRATNQANSEGFLKAAMANQDADMKARGLGLEAQMKGYQMREAARLASDEAKAANLSGFIESLGAIGMDNAALNARDFALATGTFGPVNPGYEYILTGRKPRKRGCGGKLNKGRKGLTY